jgi:hypothetical protein
MYRTELRPAGDRASYPILRLPRRYRSLAVERITVTHHEHPKYRDDLVHLTVEDLVASLRVSITTQPHSRQWSTSRRRSYPQRLDPEGQPSHWFAEQIGGLRYSRTPDILRGVNAHLDYAFFHRPDADVRAAMGRILGDGDQKMSVYGPGRFTWVPPEGPFDFRARAYRDIPRAEIVEDASDLGPVDLVNLLVGPPLHIRRATAEIIFR